MMKGEVSQRLMGNGSGRRYICSAVEVTAGILQPDVVLYTVVGESCM